MTRFFLLLMLMISFFSCFNTASNRKNRSNYSDTSHNAGKLNNLKADTSFETYDYDSTLKEGYSISFITDDSTENLYLKKDKIVIKKIASCSKGLLYKNLGYKAADFKDYFVLAHSFGSGNPNHIELIKKADGSNALQIGAAWIDVNEDKEFLLYSETSSPSPKDKMILYDAKRNQKEYFDFPKKIFDESMILDRIQLDTVTNKALIIQFETKNGLMKEKYNR